MTKPWGAPRAPAASGSPQPPGTARGAGAQSTTMTSHYLEFAGPGVAAMAIAAAESGKPILFVHDDGVYLACFAKEGEKPLVVYAAGMAPKDDGFYERARAAVGGDDFAEDLELDAFTLAGLSKAGSTLTVVTGNKHFRLIASWTEKPPAAVEEPA
jgi:predicted dienelactone hydrolase